MMYDRVKFWIDTGTAGTAAYNGIIERLNLCEVYDKHRAENIVFTKLPNSIAVNGSFTKFLQGDNLNTINRTDTECVVNALCDICECDITSARVSQFEYGATYEMRENVDKYLNLLDAAPYTKRIEGARTAAGTETLKYQATNKRKTFEHHLYNKGVEMGIEGNYLRYEVRYLRDVARQLKHRGGICLETLYNPTFYNSMQGRYYDFYNSIKKLNPMTINTDDIKTEKGAVMALFSELLNNSDPDKIGQYLDLLKRNNVFKDRSKYTRVKQQLYKIAQDNNKGDKCGLLEELKAKIKAQSEQ